MNPHAHRLARRIWRSTVCFDFETYAIDPLPQDPPAVVMSLRTDLPLPPGVPYHLHSEMLGFKTVLYAAAHANQVLTYFLDNHPEARWIGQNVAFDVVVSVLSCGVDFAKWVRVYDEDRIHDIGIREQLLAIALGWTEGQAPIDPRTGKHPAYGLAGMVLAHLGQDISEGKNDENAWRYNYHLLDGVGFDAWPDEAITYSAMDVVYPPTICENQQDMAERGTEAGPMNDGQFHVSTEADQVRAALGLYLASGNMLLADPEAVAKFEAYHRTRMEKAQEATVKAGLVKWNKLKAAKDAAQVPVTTCAFGKTNDPHSKEGKKVCCGVSPCRGGYSVDTKLLKQWVVEDWGDAVPLTDGGKDGLNPQPSTSKEVLMDPRSRPLLRAHGMAAENRKMVSTYLPILNMAVYRRIQSWFRVLVNTNRTSCGNPVNWQNPPKHGGFRDCFVASPGNVLASVDYSAIEVVALAQRLVEMFGSSELADTLNAGRDPHVWFASKLFGTTYEDMWAAYKSKDDAVKGAAKKKRQGAKAGVFGIPGGMGARRLVQTYGVDSFLGIARVEHWLEVMGPELGLNEEAIMVATPEEIEAVVAELRELATRDQKQAVAEVVAKFVREEFLAAEPRMRDYFNEIARKTRDDQTFTWHDPTTGFQRGRLGYSDGCNTQFQGRAASGAKKALWALTKACYGVSTDPRDAVMVGVRVWNFIHDEFLFEGPAETAHEWAHRASEIMVEAMKKVVPDIKVDAPPALMPRWYKDAEPVYRDGRLVPWEPDPKKQAEDAEKVDPMDEALAELAKLG